MNSLFNYFIWSVGLGLCLCQCVSPKAETLAKHTRPRVIVSTDIGGTDFDDFQSLVHLLLYADTLEVEGIISSPYGEGRAGHILEVVEAYEADFDKLVNHSVTYPSPDSLRSIVKQGATEIPGLKGYEAQGTEGSDWIIACARRADPRPLHVLIWGGIEDLAQALHDAPEILPKLRVFFIGGPNKKWSVNAYQYLAVNHPDLWIIESNASYRGWFLGGDQTGVWGNREFVDSYIKDKGALGAYFYQKGPHMKMGDSPSLTRLLFGTPEDPSQPSWGGQYVRAWDRPHSVIDRITHEGDSIEQFGVLELRIPIGPNSIESPYATMQIDRPIVGEIRNDTARFLFSPKNPDLYTYTLRSNVPSLDGVTGAITAYVPPPEKKIHPSSYYPNWWTDDPAIELTEEGYIGVKTVNRWRKAILIDFAKRMARCKP